MAGLRARAAHQLVEAAGDLIGQAARAVVDRQERWRFRHRLLRACDKLRCGFYRLPTQEALLQGGWNVLIILDACRADAFSRLEPSARAVRSLGRDTREWTGRFVARVLPHLAPGGVLWFTANPVVDSALQEVAAAGVRTVRLWESDWEMHGPERIPTVHPARVNAAVRGHLEAHGQPARMVVQYLQPHSPFIGDVALALSQWGELPDQFSKHAHALRSPAQAVRDGDVTWQDVRDAYAANLRLVLGHARDLVSALKGRVAITADHGELLGEDGRFGHDPTLHYKELYLVPWMAFDNGPFQPAPLTEGPLERGDAGTMEDRLRALGYI